MKCRKNTIFEIVSFLFTDDLRFESPGQSSKAGRRPAPVLQTQASISVSSTALFANERPGILLIDNDDHFGRTVSCFTKAYDWVKL